MVSLEMELSHCGDVIPPSETVVSIYLFEKRNKKW
jgi:hypothetical protein